MNINRLVDYVNIVNWLVCENGFSCLLYTFQLGCDTTIQAYDKIIRSTILLSYTKNKIHIYLIFFWNKWNKHRLQ